MSKREMLEVNINLDELMGHYDYKIAEKIDNLLHGTETLTVLATISVFLGVSIKMSALNEASANTMIEMATAIITGAATAAETFAEIATKQ